MQKISLDSQAQEQLEQAVSTSSGRSATTVHGGRGNSPRAARTGAACRRRDHLGGAQRRPDRHPPARHALRAIGDAAVLITVAKPG
ncbi:LuxR family transcriptional regulator [Streptomyces canus]|uniref:LuxR family transcriptional regulator n=1 Tax=Streptomyces canus TaxID=58343 RepID=UPI0039A41F44